MFDRLCSSISLYHNVDNSYLIRSWNFYYSKNDPSGLCFLQKIEEIGYKKLSNGQIIQRKKPDLEFEYNLFEPAINPGNKILDSQLLYMQENINEDNEEIAGKKHSGNIKTKPFTEAFPFRFLDLYREGLPGILYNDNSATYYYRNNGNGIFSKGEVLTNFPMEGNLNVNRYKLLNLPEADQLALVVGEANYGGFYASLGQDGWQNFTEFENYPTDFINPVAEFIDINGSGFDDLIVLDNIDPVYYPSLGAKGYGQPINLAIEDDFPLANNRNPDEFICFAKILGDGLYHRLKITSNKIECWPNLGYGQFGKKFEIMSPDFGVDFDPSRLFLIDTSGIGNVDLVYISSKEINVYLNRQGNGFLKDHDKIIKISLPETEKYTHFDQVRVVDLLGKGSACLVLTKFDIDYKHYYVDFSTGQKPYLLSNIKNGLGKSIEIKYTSSVEAYISDRTNPLTKPFFKCSFPVTVVSEVNTKDDINKIILTDRYKFHDGNYDPSEKKFVGFGFVERWNGIEDDGLPVRYTKRWHHMGVRQLYDDRYCSVLSDKLILTDSALENQVSDDKQNTEGYHALYGLLIREEIYTTGINQANILYSILNKIYAAICLKPPTIDTNGVFTIRTKETLMINCEGVAQYPIIQHEFYINWDETNNLLDSFIVYYPRREKPDSHPSLLKDSYQESCKKIYRDQQVLTVIAKHRKFTKKTVFQSNNEKFDFVGLPKEIKTYEMDATKLVYENNIYRYRGTVNLITDLKQIINHQKIHYWDEDLKSNINLPLVHHTESLVDADRKMHDVYDTVIQSNLLSQYLTSNGYILVEDDNSWWQPSLITYYDPHIFYLPIKQTSLNQSKEGSLYRSVELSYDKCQCIKINLTKYLFSASAKASADISCINVTDIDYHAVAPRKIENINGTTTEVLYDPLSVVLAISRYGKVGEYESGNYSLTDGILIMLNEEKNLEKIIDNPFNYLKLAGGIFTYSFEMITTYLTIILEDYQKQLPAFWPRAQINNPRYKINIEYHDGFSKLLQSKLKVSDERVADDILNEQKWLVSGPIQYNNRGEIYKKYLPFYSDKSRYEEIDNIKENLSNPTIYSYDILNRIIETILPNRLKTKTVYTPWYEQYFDENDLSDDAVHKNTPTIKIYDSIGNAFLNIEVLYNTENNTVELYKTKIEYNLIGKPLSLQDPRFVEMEERLSLNKKVNTLFIYDKPGRMLYEKSVDSGEKIRLYDIFGNMVHIWNSQKYHFVYEYDCWSRIISKSIEGGNKETNISQLATYEKMEYGEFLTDAKKFLQKGKLVTSYHQSGITHFNIYDIQGMCLNFDEDLYTVNALQDPAELLAIRDLQNESLIKNMPKETYNKKRYYNSLQNLIYEKDFDGSIINHTYNSANQTNHIIYYPFEDGKFKDGIIIIHKALYRATGQKERVEYGNEVNVKFDYEKNTQRLKSIDAKHNKTGAVLQKIQYYYDAVGNILKMDDQSYQVLFNTNLPEILPAQECSYDTLYRLKKATGKYLKKQDETPVTLFFKDKNPKDELGLYQEDYLYDKGSNLIRKNHVNTADAEKKDWTKLYPIDDGSNRLKNLNYDFSGNQEALENKTVLKWNYLDQLICATKTEEDKITEEYYYYNTQGLRVRKITKLISLDRKQVLDIQERLYFGNFECKRKMFNNVITNEERTLRITDGKIVVAHYHHKNQISDTELIYQLTNHLRSVTIQTDHYGELLTYEEFEPYGETSFIIGKDKKQIDKKEYRYSSKEKDEATGLYYYGARYYVTQQGRWLSTDPAGLVDGLNVYRFVKNNPMTYIDLIGMMQTDNEEAQEESEKEKPKKSANPDLKIIWDIPHEDRWKHFIGSESDQMSDILLFKDHKALEEKINFGRPDITLTSLPDVNNPYVDVKFPDTISKWRETPSNLILEFNDSRPLNFDRHTDEFLSEIFVNGKNLLWAYNIAGELNIAEGGNHTTAALHHTVFAAGRLLYDAQDRTLIIDRDSGHFQPTPYFELDKIKREVRGFKEWGNVITLWGNKNNHAVGLRTVDSEDNSKLSLEKANNTNIYHLYKYKPSTKIFSKSF